MSSWISSPSGVVERCVYSISETHVQSTSNARYEKRGCDKHHSVDPVDQMDPSLPCGTQGQIKNLLCEEYCHESELQTNKHATHEGRSTIGARKKYKIYKYVHLRGLTYIHPHMPILRPHAARSCVRKLKGNRYERHESGGALADSTNFGLLREQPSQKWEFPCLGRRCTAVQNLTPLTWSSAE